MYLSQFIFQTLSVAPSFTITPSDQIVTEKEQITFTCTASGNPVPNLTWIKDGKTVGKGDKLSFEARRNHSGIYWCSADNGIGKAINASASLDVKRKFRNVSYLINTLVITVCAVLFTDINPIDREMH